MTGLALLQASDPEALMPQHQNLLEKESKQFSSSSLKRTYTFWNDFVRVNGSNERVGKCVSNKPLQNADRYGLFGTHRRNYTTSMCMYIRLHFSDKLRVYPGLRHLKALTHRQFVRLIGRIVPIWQNLHQISPLVGLRT